MVKIPTASDLKKAFIRNRIRLLEEKREAPTGKAKEMRFK